MKKKSIAAVTFLCLILHITESYAQKYPAKKIIDVQSYKFEISVNDSNDSLVGAATIQFNVLEETLNLKFDLASVRGNGRGMIVTSVFEGGKNLMFNHEHDQVRINFPVTLKPGEEHTILISYRGIPADGLIISKNKYNHRTFFADNWPNRAHHWLACIDHPSDKATVEFIVQAPVHYQVIANGVKVEEINLSPQQKLTHFREVVPLPMKVAVIGIAAFAVQQAGVVDGIPVESWVYPEDRQKGFSDYAQALEVLPFFTRMIAQYPYKKLANVQSKTIFGGMENAGAIFYFENSVTGKHEMEALLAHEIAHQWFGDMATETHWSHVWLSEGFATYLTHLYLEHKYGPDSLRKRMAEDRQAIIGFSKRKTGPVVDSTVSNYMDLLNVNSYQKGGWVLHMLRNAVGDSIFWRGLRSYYNKFAGRNASTEDFQKIMEDQSRQDLKQFFRQWLYTPGIPALSIQWTYDTQRRSLIVTINQQQKQLFQLPLTIRIQLADDTVINRTVAIKEQQTILALPAASRPKSVIADPGVVMLFDGSVKEVSR
ncbi:MAG TPA: M1 family metallopeptidase [Flavitalea sp.]|nr:M1 family metallopeptidase [Flavitalea sp.]